MQYVSLPCFLSSDFCKMLDTPMEMKEFKVFRELRDNIAMDLGVVKPAQNNTVSTTIVFHLLCKRYLPNV